ncbi:MAG: efflux RND transporter permease subunit [Planctomycetota bacterium]|nr:MAG: efflux RND transporter permease subunit [Planctomycetota bacterium]
MDFIRFCIQNPVKVTVCVLLSMLFGTVSLLGTPVQLTPDVSEPEITVTTLWPGASAQEVEREITDEQEEQLKSVEGLREFKSESRDGASTITLRFPVGTNLSDARARINDKLNLVARYPIDAREPTISEGAANTEFVCWIILKPLPPTVQELESFVQIHPELREKLTKYLDGSLPVDLGRIAGMAETIPAFEDLLRGRPDPTRMRKFTEDFIEARFERVPGVAASNVLGGQEEEFRVVVDPAKLAAHHLTVSDLQRALREQNANISAGDIWEGKQRNIVRTLGQFDTADKVADTIVSIRDNSPVRVRDIGSVGIDYKKPDGVVRQKGINGLAINCQQAPNTNVLEIMGPPRRELDLDHDGTITQFELSESRRIHGDNLRIAIEELNTGVLAQKGLELEQVYDQTEYIHSAVDMVEENIYAGSALALLVLWVFLRNFRTVAIIGISIPISVIASFIFIKALGRSINVISLAGMAFAVGMAVDNAIVVLENIFRRYELGESPEEASIKGTAEVWGAVFANTCTTLAVLIPIILIEGQAGQLFRDISIAITYANVLSMAVSFTVVPVAACKILKPHPVLADGTKAIGSASPFGTEEEKPGLITSMVNGFVRWLKLMMTIRGSVGVRLVAVVLMVAGSYWGSQLMMPRMEYLPEGNRNLVFAILLPPSGYNIDQMIKVGRRVEADMAKYWETEPGSPEEAALDGPRMKNFFFVARGGRLFMGAAAEDPLSAGGMVPVMQKAASQIPGTFAIVAQSSLFQGGLSGGRSIDVDITGPDMARLNQLGSMVFMQAMGIGPYEGQGVFPPVAMSAEGKPIPTGHQVTPRSNLESTNPELHVLPNWENAADLGVSVEELGYAVNALVDGAYAGDYWHDGRKIDLVIYGADEFTRRSQDLENLPVSTRTGKVVNIGGLATIKATGGPEVVNHIERQRSVTIQIKPNSTMALDEAISLADEKIRMPLLNSPLTEGGLYQIRFAGTADKLQDTQRAMSGSLVMAGLITYLLMCGLFESYFYPLIIMTSVALGMVGGFAGLALLNIWFPQPMDTLTMLGFVILIGVVVNNAILIVHQALQNMKGGMDHQTAILDSTRTRLRPIFMSTITTVLGMLPLVVPMPSWAGGQLVFIPGAGSELYRGLGSVVLGGLIVSTVFTLVLIPLGFSLALDAKTLLDRLLNRSQSLGTSAETPPPTPPR